MRRWDLAGGQVDTQAVDAIQLEIRRSAYRVGWVDWRIEQLLEKERALLKAGGVEGPGTPDRGGDAEEDPTENRGEAFGAVQEDLRWWLRESRAERKHLVEVSGVAVRAGLTKYIVSQLELERETVSRVLLAALNALELTEEQKLLAVASMYAEVERVAVERREKVIVGELLA